MLDVVYFADSVCMNLCQELTRTRKCLTDFFITTCTWWYWTVCCMCISAHYAFVLSTCRWM